MHFLASENLGPLSVALILDLNLLSSFLKCRSLMANIFIFIHRKTLSMAEVYIGYNLNAQTHNKLPSMIGSQPIICFLILDCSKYSQVGSLLAHCFCFFFDLKLDRKKKKNNFYSAIRWSRPILFFLDFFADFTNFSQT